MSNQSNTSLEERAAEVMAYFEGTDLELAISNAMHDDDLDVLAYLVHQGEAEISQQEFFNNDMVGDNDAY
jgi:hypothetical protein